MRFLGSPTLNLGQGGAAPPSNPSLPRRWTPPPAPSRVRSWRSSTMPAPPRRTADAPCRVDFDVVAAARWEEVPLVMPSTLLNGEDVV